MQKTKKLTKPRTPSEPQRQRQASEKNTAAQMQREVKRRGEIGEAAFLSKAASLGFGVSKPWGDSDRYDLVVDVGGRMLRVQVKSAHCVSKKRGGGYHIGAGCNRHRESYRDDEIDLLVAYIVPENIWYIFPPSAFKNMKAIHLFTRGKKPPKFEQYREAWHAFHEVK